MKFFKKFIRNEKAATAIEYGLLASLIAVAIIVPVTAVGGALKDVFETLTTSLT